jgi:hypothetical protein
MGGEITKTYPTCDATADCHGPYARRGDFVHHRSQRVDNKRNSARLPRYLAAGRVLSNPPIIVPP